ncbi:MAG: peptidase C1 [Leptospiraceae bacterium]|nr:hypothetical protein [Leptospiraceae bacterium]MCP5498086.1 peptidase C1 [Leptospiraceae bacterium]
MSEFVIKRADGSERKISGYMYAAPGGDRKKYASGKYGEEKLPPKVDLRHYMTNVENQGELNSCVANAVAGAYEYLVKKHKGIDQYDVSRLFIYYNARQLDNMENEDAGSFIASAIESLKEHGACSEDTWPYDPELVNEEPEEDAYVEAAEFLVEDVEWIPTDLFSWKHSLAEGYPIIFGISLFESFDYQRKKGLVPMPTEKETSRESHGGHAMLCVGYSDPDKLFIVRNSWGNDWGDNGYCYIPYNYLINEKFNGGDSWIIRQLDNFEVDEETWGDDSSITGDYETELAEMSDEDYNDMLDDMGEYPLEFRIAHIMLYGANEDGEISEEEYDEIAAYLRDTLDKLGVELDAKKILKNCMKEIDNEDLLEESVELLGEYLSKSLLAKIAKDVEEIIGIDDLSEEEENFVYGLVEAWQIEEGEDED